MMQDYMMENQAKEIAAAVAEKAAAKQLLQAQQIA